MYRVWGYGPEELSVLAGDDVQGWGMDETDGLRLSVEFDWDGEDLCTTCGASIEEDGDGHEEYCDQQGEPPPDRVGRWANSAFISCQGGELTVGISCGDPRGAWTMTLRRLDDGTRVLHVPHAGASFAHTPLRELHPGTYQIGG